MRVALVVVLSLAAVWLVLGWFEIVPLPFGWQRGAAESEAGSGRDAEAAREAESATLVGRAGKAKSAEAAVIPEAAPVPAEVRGSVPHGAVLRGRVVAAGNPAVPVAGAAVRLLRPHAVTAFLKTPAEGRWDELQARTGKDGRFAFLDVRPARSYVVRARIGAGAGVSSDRFEVLARQVKDLGDLVLRATGTLEGQVTDGSGAPVAGAQVAVAWQVETFMGLVMADPELLPEIEARTVTDASGRYRLTPLEVGNKTMVVSSASNGGSAATVSVGEGVTVHDVKLDAVGVIAGKVEWEDGKPAADIRVFAVEARRESGMVISAKSGVDGSFRLEHVPGNDLRLSAFVPGIPVRPTGPTVPGTTDVVLRLPLTGALTGRVVRKADGQAVQRFGVLLEPQGDEDFTARALRRMMGTAVGPQGFVSPDGAFRVPVLAEGTYVVVVQAAGFPEGRSAPVVVPAAGTGDAGTIALVEGNGVAGVVRTANGEPVANAEVYLVAYDAGSAPGEVHIEVDETRGGDARTDEEGRFTLGPQTPSRYQITVRHPFIEAHVERDIDLKNGPRLDLDVRVKSAGNVLVTFVESDGTPAPQENVALLRADGYSDGGWTDADGRWRFESVPVGACLVCGRNVPQSLLRAFGGAEDDDTRSRAWDAVRAEVPETVVRAGLETKVTVKVARRVPVRLKVHPWAEDVKQVVDVWFMTREGYNWYRAPRQEDGTFLGRVPVGTYTVFAVPSTQGWDGNKTFSGVVIPDVASHELELGR
jgi:protocatechuate 3,4-dioxygenase beta subunit